MDFAITNIKGAVTSWSKQRRQVVVHWFMNSYQVTTYDMRALSFGESGHEGESIETNIYPVYRILF